ncbi:hypothetical protein ZOSMA_182G00010 [Zostera marina]|uniref:Myb-like domain-containing protein n=1 Tax=Zostera marina TaxID=29655 RepID=A0A0K9PSU5_ZOSMR|nr:hypothetical protein ZOSMA_182G00010 [Zostera marina]
MRRIGVDDITNFILDSHDSAFIESTTFTKKQIESSVPFSPSRVLSDDIEYDPDFVDPLNHSSQSVLNQEPSNHPHVDTSILDCGIDSQDIQLNDFFLSSQNGDARHDLLHSSLAASGASKAEHTFPSYLLNGTSDPTIFDHTISKTVNKHDNVTLNTDQVISDEEVVDFFSNEDLIDDLIIQPAAPSCVNASDSIEFNPNRRMLDGSKRRRVDGLSITSGNNRANAENTMIYPDWATSTHTGSETNAEEGSKTMKLRKRMTAHSPVFSFDDENDGDGGDFDTCQCEDNVDDEYTNEEMGRKKKARKAISSSQEKQKPVQKRKKSCDNVHHSNQVPKKKFPHSTRRKRRLLDKKLLETPDEEIDERRIPIKDLILLSEARERISVKEAASNKSKDSNDNEDGEESRSLEKYNHHSFMNKARSERWSKAGTELFYQAIRQFGTDFGMIQQLFPNRTRHQMKLKFKSEERKYPMQIADALTHRSNDFSQFEILIKQLEIQSSTKYENSPIEAETERNDLGSIHDFSSVAQKKEEFVIFDDDEFVDFG